MSRRPVLAALAALAVAGLCATVALGAAARADGPRVVARDADGAVIAEASLPPDGRFALAYRHSVYRAPAQERFRARAAGRFELEAIASPSAEVVDYYALDGRTARVGGWLVQRLATPARFARLDVAATTRGRRTLVVAGRRLALYREGERAMHVRIAVEG